MTSAANVVPPPWDLPEEPQAAPAVTKAPEIIGEDAAVPDGAGTVGRDAAEPAAAASAGDAVVPSSEREPVGPADGAPTTTATASAPGLDAGEAPVASASIERPPAAAASEAAPTPELAPTQEAAPTPELAPTQEAAPEEAAAERRAPDTTGGEDSETLRRRWDEVLATLSDLKKATWILVKDNAHVAELTQTTLRLAFTAPGLVGAFRNGPHPGLVQQAVRETLGYDVTVEAEVQGDAPVQRVQPAAVAPPVTRTSAHVDDAPVGRSRTDGVTADAPRPGDEPRSGNTSSGARGPGAATSDGSAAGGADAARVENPPAEPVIVDSWDVVPVGTWTADPTSAAQQPAEPRPAEPQVVDSWDVVPVGSAKDTSSEPPAADPWARGVEPGAGAPSTPEGAGAGRGGAAASGPAAPSTPASSPAVAVSPPARSASAPSPASPPSSSPVAPPRSLGGAAAARAAALAARANAQQPRTATPEPPVHDDVPPLDDEPSYDEYEDSVPFTETTLMGVPLVVKILEATVLEETVDDER